MASLCSPAPRYLISSLSRSLRVSNQRRWAQVHDVRFLATTQHRRAVVEKYREKLDRKAKEEGHKGFGELKAAYADRIQEVRRKDAIEIPTLSQIPSAAETPRAATFAAGGASPSGPEAKSANPAVKPLSSILDLPKARALPDKELSAIWRLRHASAPNSLCAVIPAATYAAMEAAAQRSPQFVLPVPHEGQGAEIHFLQWTFNAETRTATVLFTQLAEFKTRGEYAQPHTTVTHHTDLAEERGVVLMQGQVMEGKGVKIEDAQWLAMCLQRFYGEWEGGGADAAMDRGAKRKQLLEWFAAGDPRFSVEALMDEAERLA